MFKQVYLEYRSQKAGRYMTVQNQQGKTTAQWMPQKTGSAPMLAANTSVKHFPNMGHLHGA